jgi:DNA mismatch endonuclease (patch repair protein)
VPNLTTDPANRSYLMSTIRAENTRSELIVFAAMKAAGIGYRAHYKRAPGTPDLARPRKKLALFIDGDFWHGREIDRVIEKHGRDSAWAKKLLRNIQRDAEQNLQLAEMGWSVLRVWDSDLRRVRTRAATLASIETFFRSRDEITQARLAQASVSQA